MYNTHFKVALLILRIRRKTPIVYFQVKLFDSIKPLFKNKPLIIVLNKMDIVSLNELPPEKRSVLKPLESDANTPVLEMSTVTDHGVMEVKTEACERLLALRVDQKLKTKKVIFLSSVFFSLRVEG